MRTVFAGTPEFAAVALRAVLDSGHEVAAVFTQPDRPAGRGRTLRPSAVKVLAQERGVEVFQPATLRSARARTCLHALAPDVIVVAAYGLLLPPDVLCVPPQGCVNVHASLLPRWRGAAPVERAILAGDERTGVSIMLMDEGLDTGDILARSELAIGATECAGELRGRLAVLGAELLVATLDELPRARAHSRPQHGSEAIYAERISKHEARLDWSLSAEELDRVVRAMNPAPVAFTTVPTPRHGPRRLRIWRSRPGSGVTGEVAGQVLRGSRHKVEISTGHGRLTLVEVQEEGGRRMPVDEYARSQRLAPGTVLGLRTHRADRLPGTSAEPAAPNNGH